jgi:TolB-like protein
VALGIVAGIISVTALGLQWNRTDGVRPGASNSKITTIFVAPFTINESGERISGAQLADQVRTALSADESVLTSRSEIQTAKAQLAAARRSGAHYVLIGTVDQKQRGAQITLHLVRADDASTAWSGTFWKSTADFPSSSRDLAAAVSEAIRAPRESETRQREDQSRRTREPP